jgi:hypothetical protein
LLLTRQNVRGNHKIGELEASIPGLKTVAKEKNLPLQGIGIKFLCRPANEKVAISSE